MSSQLENVAEQVTCVCCDRAEVQSQHITMKQGMLSQAAGFFEGTLRTADTTLLFNTFTVQFFFSFGTVKADSTLLLDKIALILYIMLLCFAQNIAKDPLPLYNVDICASCVTMPVVCKGLSHTFLFDSLTHSLTLKKPTHINLAACLYMVRV